MWKSPNSEPISMMRKLPGSLLACLIALGVATTSGCSTLGVDGAKVKPLPAAAQCPHPRAYASWHTFTGTTQVKQGESAFQTVKRFRVAEAEKNKAGQRLWEGMKACRQDKAPEPKDSGADDASITDLFSGGTSSLPSQ